MDGKWQDTKSMQDRKRVVAQSLLYPVGLICLTRGCFLFRKQPLVKQIRPAGYVLSVHFLCLGQFCWVLGPHKMDSVCYCHQAVLLATCFGSGMTRQQSSIHDPFCKNCQEPSNFSQHKRHCPSPTVPGPLYLSAHVACPLTPALT